MKKQEQSNKVIIAYVVLELAYFDGFLSAVDVIGVFTSKKQAKQVVKDITATKTSSLYTFKGIVQETIIT